MDYRDIDDDTASSGSQPENSHLLENVNLVDLGTDEMDIKLQTSTTTNLFQQSHNLE